MNKTCKECGIVPTKFYRKEFCGTCYNKLLIQGKIPRLKDKFVEITDILTQEQEKVLIGLMLGDGHLKKAYTENSNSALFVIRSTKDKEYLLENYNTFLNFCNDKAIRYRNTINYALAKLNDSEPKELFSITLETRKSKEFTKFRNIWYPEGKKIIPRSIKELDPLSIAIWLADDGSVSEYRKDKLKVTFHTNGFLKEDTKYLISLLEDKYGEGFILYPKNKEKQQFIIICYDKLARKLLKDIDSVFPKSMSRKSDIWRNVQDFYNPNYIGVESTNLKINGRYESALKALDYFDKNNIITFNIKTFANAAGLILNGRTFTNQSKTYINRLLKENLIVQVNNPSSKYAEKLYTRK